MAELKTVPTTASAASFIAAIDDAQKRADSETLLTLLAEVSGEPPVMWGPSIVGFGHTHFRYASGREGDTCILGFSPRKQALTLYISGLDQQPELLAQLGKHSRTKGCLYLKRLSDINLAVLRQLLHTTLPQPRP